MLEKISTYHLEKQLGSKKLRSTYLAYSSQGAQRSVVIKVFDEACLNADYEQEKYQDRFKALSMLSNPHIVPVLDSAIEEKQLYIVTEYMSHGSLRSRLNTFTKNKHMDWPEALRIVIQVGQALSYVHDHQILHGAMKPENILYDPNGDVRLTDFTLAPIVDLAKLEYKSDLYVTHYMAPEQFIGKLDYRSDQYALACLAYELMAGNPLFEASSFSAMWGRHATEQPPRLTSMVSNLPMSVEIAILKALEKEPDNRYPDVAAFVKALDVFASRQSSISSLITDPSATFNLPSLNPPSHSPDNPSQSGSASSAALSISKDQREQSSRSSVNLRVTDPGFARINDPVTSLSLPLTDIDSAISAFKQASSSQALSDSLPRHILPQSTDPDIKLSGSAWRRKKNTVLPWVAILIALILVVSLISTVIPTPTSVIPTSTPGVSHTPISVQSGTQYTVGQAPTPPSNPGQGASKPAAVIPTPAAVIPTPAAVIPTPAAVIPTPTVVMPKPTITAPRPIPTAPNLIQNGSFENGSTSPWYFYPTGGAAGNVLPDSTTSVAGNVSAKINITQANSDPNNAWYIQLGQNNVPLVNGRKYTITFWAKASQQRTMNQEILQDTSPWMSYMTQDVVLTTTWTKYTCSFTSTKSVADTELNFNMAQSPGTVWIDDISMN